ncbi:hypothetical protein [Hyphomicrobium sp. LHD-15]|uniref:hypothetical protein n=1 Tax=Hyphomicrobium sp. LHD-15 TaxID=3072142 RepID=UPI00280FA032|nr:hypothetical protein [Hyphomicrobium sp. LHD-15]MDQ8700396.1 hypothetical protein [Hyphomicrobium sp. LHD-15]
MFVLRILLNGVIMAAEIAAVAGVAALGFYHPFLFAALTAGLSFLLGLRLEMARLSYELPFYFEGQRSPRRLLVALVGGVEALMKGVLAGLAALFTFGGTDSSRLFWVAVVFGLTTYLGSSALRALSVSFRAQPWRWGYFRLGPPLGLLFSAGLAAFAAVGLIHAASVGEIGWKLVWELPEKPSVSQVSELFFQLKQAFDDFIVTLLATVMPQEWARLVGVVISVNVLTGFVASVYAAVIAACVRTAEEGLP